MQASLMGATPLFLVFDMPTAVAFYRDALDFEVVRTSEPFDDGQHHYDWAMLRRDAVTLMLNAAYESGARPDEPNPSRTCAHGDTVIYIGCRELDSLVADLRERGVTVGDLVATSYGMMQATVQDPDGYTLCFQRPAVDRLAPEDGL